MTSVQPSYSIHGLTTRWSVLAAALFLAGSKGFIIAGVLPGLLAERAGETGR